MTTRAYMDDLLVAVQAIIQLNLAEQRQLTSNEINQLYDYAWTLAALNDECFDEYNIELI